MAAAALGGFTVTARQRQHSMLMFLCQDCHIQEKLQTVPACLIHNSFWKSSLSSSYTWYKEASCDTQPHLSNHQAASVPPAVSQWQYLSQLTWWHCWLQALSLLPLGFYSFLDIYCPQCTGSADNFKKMVVKGLEGLQFCTWTSLRKWLKHELCHFFSALIVICINFNNI